MLKDLLERYLAVTGSEKASELLADWPTAKTRFKVLVPPSERAAMGLTEKQAVAA
jgi:glutamate synthase (ferredoxin)